jgi:hypothetical protein
MVAVRYLLLASLAAGGVALQQPSQVGKDSDGTYREVSSKMDELHAGLAKIKAESLNAVSKAKAEFDMKLNVVVARNREVVDTNVKLASEIKGLQENNVALTNESEYLMEECRGLAADLKTMQSNISMAQEFIGRTINSANLSLHGSSELDILHELDEKDAIVDRKKHHEKRLSDLEELTDQDDVMMLQMNAKEEPGSSQDLLNELLSRWSSISGQQGTSLTSLKEAYEREQARNEKEYTSLLQEQSELNTTKRAEEALNVKLRRAVAHLRASRERLAQEKSSLQTFAKRLGLKPVQGTVTPSPNSLDMPRSSVAQVEAVHASAEDEIPATQPTKPGLLGTASWLSSTLR